MKYLNLACFRLTTVSETTQQLKLPDIRITFIIYQNQNFEVCVQMHIRISCQTKQG